MSTPHPIDGETRLYGVVGHPVARSLSPCMHNAAFRAMGYNAVYVPLPIRPEQLETAVAGLRAAGLAGFNLTVPHKQAILPMLDDVTAEARAIGAVNTVRCEEGRMHGTNTDAPGFLLSLQHDLDWHPAGRTALMLGAGGAARAVAFALLGEGLAALHVANRTVERAEALCADLRPRFPSAKLHACGLEQAGDLQPHLLVNTTSVGMGDGRSPMELAPVGVRAAVADIVYAPPETPLLEQARALGLRCTNGIGMLLYQGWLAGRFWTDREPPLAAMQQALAPYAGVPAA